MCRNSNDRSRRSVFASTALVVLVALTIGGCGVKGPLKLPPATATPPASSSGAQSAPATDSPQDERKP